MVVHRPLTDIIFNVYDLTENIVHIVITNKAGHIVQWRPINL